MIMETIDGLPAGSLSEFHNHRVKNYNHVYYCYRCVRSFDTKEETSICRFCGAAVRDITGYRFEKPIARKYRYYCTNCENKFESFTLFENCPACSKKIMHIYEWEELDAMEKILIRFRKMFRMNIDNKNHTRERKRLSFPSLFRRSEELPSDAKSH